jgi:hypothetical protein
MRPLVFSQLCRGRQRADVHFLTMDDEARYGPLPGVGPNRRRWRFNGANGFAFRNAASASRNAEPVRMNPIAVGPSADKITTLSGGEVKSSSSANPRR